jgi:hypothetical protein
MAFGDSNEASSQYSWQHKCAPHIDYTLLSLRYLSESLSSNGFRMLLYLFFVPAEAQNG